MQPLIRSILLATWNPMKAGWMSQGFAHLGLEVNHLRPGAIDEPDETGNTCEANARLKVAAVGLQPGAVVVGEDSGLFIDALGGFPGTHTARWAPGTDDDRSLLLLERLAGVPLPLRTARFVSALALLFPDGTLSVCTGEMHGWIATEPRGDLDRGYGRIFGLPGGTTIAELGPGRVEPQDHRRKALQQAAALVAGFQWNATREGDSV